MLSSRRVYEIQMRLKWHKLSILSICLGEDIIFFLTILALVKKSVDIFPGK